MPMFNDLNSNRTIFSYFKNIAVKILIHYKGIRIFEQNSLLKDSNCNSILIGQTSIRTTDNSQLVFSFYKKIYKDKIYKRGKLNHETFIGYGIECHFDDNFPDHLRRFNNLKFVTKNTFLKLAEEKVILHMLMEIYVGFINNENSNHTHHTKY